MTKDLNKYGDKFQPTADGRGVDISSQRQDELDRGAVDFVLAAAQRGGRPVVLDLGGGFGTHSIRLAAAGADVTMIDLFDMASANFSCAMAAGQAPERSLRFLQKDFATITPADIPAPFDLLYSQRAIHYVPYAEAKKLLSIMFNAMSKDSAVFISAAGWDTEYGKTYPDRDKPLEDRFNFVTSDMQEKHGITHKIVTYKEEDMQRLLAESGFSRISVAKSEFGNIKAQAFKP